MKKFLTLLSLFLLTNQEVFGVEKKKGTITQGSFIHKINELIERDQKAQEDKGAKNVNCYSLSKYNTRLGYCGGLSRIYVVHALGNRIDNFVIQLQDLAASEISDSLKRQLFVQSIVRAQNEDRPSYYHRSGIINIKHLIVKDLAEYVDSVLEKCTKINDRTIAFLLAYLPLKGTEVRNGHAVVLVKKKGESGYEFYDPNLDGLRQTNNPGSTFSESCMRTYQHIKPLQMAVCGEMVFDISSSKETSEKFRLPHDLMPLDSLEGKMIREFNKDVQEIHLAKNQEEKNKNEAILWGNRHWEAYPLPHRVWLSFALVGKKLRPPEANLKRSAQMDERSRQQFVMLDTLTGMVKSVFDAMPEKIRYDLLPFVYTILKNHFIKNLVEKNFFQYLERNTHNKSTKESEVGPALKTDSENLKQLEEGLKWLQSKSEIMEWGMKNAIDDSWSIEGWQSFLEQRVEAFPEKLTKKDDELGKWWEKHSGELELCFFISLEKKNSDFYSIKKDPELNTGTTNLILQESLEQQSGLEKNLSKNNKKRFEKLLSDFWWRSKKMSAPNTIQSQEEFRRFSSFFIEKMKKKVDSSEEAKCFRERFGEIFQKKHTKMQDGVQDLIDCHIGMSETVVAAIESSLKNKGEIISPNFFGLVKKRVFQEVVLDNYSVDNNFLDVKTREKLSTLGAILRDPNCRRKYYGGDFKTLKDLCEDRVDSFKEKMGVFLEGDTMLGEAKVEFMKCCIAAIKNLLPTTIDSGDEGADQWWERRRGRLIEFMVHLGFGEMKKEANKKIK